MSVRTEFRDQVAAAWVEIPALAGLRVIATEAELDDVQVPTALIRMKSLGLFSPAPLSHRNVGLLLTLISAHIDLDRAGDELDGIVDAALDWLDPRFPHEDATAVAYGDRLAFDIPVTVVAQKEPSA